VQSRKPRSLAYSPTLTHTLLVRTHTLFHSPDGTACFNGEAGANNFPLRGGKYSPWEGGIRVNAFASGGCVSSIL